jgi:hypothetical protein
MGEYAEYRIDGSDCQDCGLPFDDPGEGFPRSCHACRADDAPRVKPVKRAKSVPCAACKRTFHNLYALAQHRSAKEH